jgi:hypothetical protein
LKKRTKKLLTYVEPGGASEVSCQQALPPCFLSAARLNVTIFASFFQKRSAFFLPA